MRHRLDIDTLYARHREGLLVFLARRTADPQIALDLWAETFAQALAGGHRYRGETDDEAAAWLYTIGHLRLPATGVLRGDMVGAGPAAVALEVVGAPRCPR